MALNDYDELLDQSKGSGNEYTDLLNSDKLVQKQALQQSMYMASKSEPDQKSKAIELAEKTRLPVSIVERNFDEVSKKAQQASVDYDAIIDESPALAKWLEHPDNATLAKDDLNSLKQIESTVKDKGFGSELIDAFKSGAASFASGIAKAPALSAGASDNLTYSMGQTNFEFSEESQQKKVLPRELLDNPVTQYLDKTAKDSQPEDMSADIIQSFRDGDYTKAARSMAFQLVSNIPQLGFIVASRGAGLPLMAASSAGNKMAQNIEAGIEPGAARSNALITGGIEAGIESIGGIGGSSLKESVKAIAKDVGPQATKEILKDGFFHILKTSGEEGAEEFATSLAQDALDYATDVNPDAFSGSMQRALNAALVGAGSGGLMAGTTHAPLALLENHGKKIRSDEAKESYLAINDTIQNSKLNQRSPKKMAEYVESVTKGTAAENIYIPVDAADTYFQSKKVSAAQVMQEIGALDQYNEAKKTGADIKIPLSTWVSKAGNTEHYAGLANDIKFDPKNLTVNESSQINKQSKEDLQKEADASLPETSNEPTPEDQIYSQLIEAGIPETQAKFQAQIFSGFEVLAKRSNVDLKELVSKFLPNIRTGEMGMQQDGQIAAQSFDQAQRYRSNFSARPGGLNLGVTTHGDTLSLNPLEGVEASGTLTDQAGQKTFLVENFKTTEKYLGVASDMISSLEKQASIKGADTIITSTKRLGIDINSPIADLYKQAGFKTKKGADGDTILVKKLETPRTFNQSSKNEFQDSVPLPSTVASLDLSGPLVSIKEARALVKGKLKTLGSIINTHTGWNIDFSREGRSKSGQTISSEPNIRSYLNIDKLTENAIYLRSEDNNSDDPNIKKIHFLYAPFTYGGKQAIVKITVKETNRGQKFYDKFALEKENAVPGTLDQTRGVTAQENLGSIPNSPTMNISDFISEVKSLRQQDPFFQPGEDAPRGQIRFGKDGAIDISLFKNKDESTFLHETGHLYLEVLAHLSKQDGVPSRMKEDIKLIEEYLGTSIDNIKTEHHEKWARSFEAYLRTGKAPSTKLRQAFARFKVWLTAIYKKMTDLDVELSPEIVGVMDRILATDEEINAVYREQNIEPLFGRHGAYKMNDQKAEAYEKARFDAEESAKAEVTAKLMKDFARERESWWKEKRSALIPDIEKQVNDNPAYRALSIMKDGALPDGTALADMEPIKLSRSALKETFTKEQIDSLPKGIIAAKDQGMHHDVAAELLGFKSGNELVQSLFGLPKKQDLIDSMADRQMEALYPELMNNQEEMKAAAEDAVHNDKRSQVLRLELEHLASNDMPVLKDVIRRMVRRVPSEKVVREQAAEILAKRKVKDVSPYIFQLAEAKAAKEAGEALTRGDIDKAFELKQKELLNHELYRAAMDARDQVEKALETFKKFNRTDEDLAKSRDMDLINAGRAVLTLFGLGKTGKPASAYLENIKKYDPSTYETINALVLAATENVGPYKDIPLNDFITLKDTIDAIWDLSKSSKEIEIDGKTILHDDAVIALQEQVRTLAGPQTKPGYDKAVTKWEKTKMHLLSARASLTRVEAWVEAVDMGNPNGPFRTYVWNPISQATTKYRLAKSDSLNKYMSIIKDLKVERKEIQSPELNYTFKDKTELLMAVLHSGNESNLDKLLRGRPDWATKGHEGEVVKTRWNKFISRMQAEGVLTKNDYDVAQKIWDLMEELKPGAQKAHKEMYGHYFNEITASEIVTPFGTYRGGYIPAKVDMYTTEDAAIRQEREDFEKNNNSYQFPTTGRGFTKARTQEYAAPLSLEMSMLAGHIDGVLRFAHLEPTVKQVARIVQDKGFRSVLSDLDSQAGKELLTPWLQRAATQKVVLPSDNGIGRVTDNVASYLRKSVAMQMMVGNVTNTLQQFTGLVVAMSKVSPRHIRNGLVTYISDIKKTTNDIMDKSEWMKSTQGSNVYETYQAIDKIIVDPGVFERAQDFATKHTYVLQSMTQNIVNTIVWTGAYNQAIEKGADEKQAVLEADSAVRLTQGSNSPEDISRFETGTPTKRLFTQFAGYFNMIANLNGTEIFKISKELGMKKGAGKLFYVYLTAFMLPAVLSEIIVQAMSGKGLDADDDDKYLDDMLSIFFGSQFRTATAMVPYVGPTINAAVNSFNKNVSDDRVSLSPVISIIESSVGVPAEVYKAARGQMSDNKRVVKDALMLIGTASGLPTGPVGKPVGYLMDVKKGKAKPKGPVDFSRGLLTGKSGMKDKN